MTILSKRASIRESAVNSPAVVSNVATQLGPFTGWFLPAKDQIELMYLNLHFAGVGGFASGTYWSSTEATNLSAGAQNFGSGIWNGELGKSVEYNVRACRSFTTDTVYNLRDIGPAGGWIFSKVGTTYLECAPSDQSAAQAWSNVTNGVSTATSETDGQSNTTLIIAQSTHTDSAALLCDSLVIGGSEVVLSQDQIDAIAAQVPPTDITGKVDKVTGSSLVTDTEISKLAGIAAGAEVNVQADWNASSGDAQILNKPTIPVVSDTSYNATSWDGNTDAPTKNAVRDKIESLGTGSTPTSWGKYF